MNERAPGIGGSLRWLQIGLGAAIAAMLLLAGAAVVAIDDDMDQAQVLDADERGLPTSTPATAATTPTTAAASVPTSPSATLVADKRELVIFMQPSATPANVDAVRRDLKAMTDVQSIRYVDKAAAYQEMKALFADQPGVIEKVELIDAPENFHVLPRSGVDRHVIGARLEKHTGVLSVVYPGE